MTIAYVVRLGDIGAAKHQPWCGSTWMFLDLGLRTLTRLRYLPKPWVVVDYLYFFSAFQRRAKLLGVIFGIPLDVDVHEVVGCSFTVSTLGKVDFHDPAYAQLVKDTGNAIFANVAEDVTDANSRSHGKVFVGL